MKVLIIEDSIEVGRYLRLFIKKHITKDVDVALSAHEAQAFLDHNKYNFIICDIELPCMKGPQILLSRELHGAGIIFCSAVSDIQGAITPCIMAGLSILGSKQKPFLADEIRGFFHD